MKWIIRHKFIISLLYPLFTIVLVFAQRIGHYHLFSIEYYADFDVYLFDFPYYAALFILLSLICIIANIFLKLYRHYYMAICVNLICYGSQMATLLFWWILHQQRQNINVVDFPTNIDYIGFVIFIGFIALPVPFLWVQLKMYLGLKMKSQDVQQSTNKPFHSP